MINAELKEKLKVDEFREGFDEGYKKATERSYERQKDLTETYIRDGEIIKKQGEDIAELKEENEELKAQVEDLQINVYSNLCEQRKTMHRNLIEAFSEQLGILDKEDDKLFSLKAIKEIISNILEIAD